jgi:formylglycine-generating enzyme required for sulfatase activity
LVWIPPGTFIMGSSEDEKDRRSNEGPETQVTISRGFWMAKYETTLAQYRLLTGKAPRRLPFSNVEDNWPVTEVTWEKVNDFCALLNQEERNSNRLPEGYEYRLPTEAEWEYACRAGTKQRFSFGDDPAYAQLEAYAWYSSNSTATPHPVGTRLPNPWGLYDMHGNALEWCLDYQQHPGGSASDPVGSISDPRHAMKGGAWNAPGSSCRSAFRHTTLNLDGRWALNEVGFRVVLAPTL